MEESMSKALIAAVVAALGLGLGADAIAQPTAPSGTTQSQPARESWRNTQNLVESSKIIGMRIKNAEGKDIGEIDRLLIDPKTGRVGQAVIGVGGLAGIGERRVVVPWADVAANVRRDGDRMVVTMDQAMLEQAPRYEAGGARSERSSPSASPSTDRTRK
jgi:sporulation protein YlmC with PRC-barrel domain